MNSVFCIGGVKVFYFVKMFYCDVFLGEIFFGTQTATIQVSVYVHMYDGFAGGKSTYVRMLQTNMHAQYSNDK